MSQLMAGDRRMKSLLNTLWLIASTIECVKGGHRIA